MTAGDATPLPDPKAAVIWPTGYAMRPDGLKQISGAQKGGGVRVCAPFQLLARTRATDGTGWGRWIKFRDPDGVAKQVVIPDTELIGDSVAAIRRLVHFGLVVDNASQLAEALRQATTPTRARLVTRPGWNGDSYVFGCEAFGPVDGEPFAFDGIQGAPPAIGTLEGWKDSVGKWARGNSRLVAAISQAFVGPLLRPLSAEGFAVHLRGKSSIGKSTTLHAARSVIGQPVGSWRATINGPEGEAVAANDGLMTLDELSEVEPFSAGRSVYMLANGTGKARAEVTGASKSRAQWLVTTLSTGEITLGDKIEEEGKGKRARASGGQNVRLLDVPADAGAGLGVFEHLHDFKEPSDLARAIRRTVDQEAGTAFRSFLRDLTSNRSEAVAFAKSIRADFRAAAPNLDPQANRVRDHFGLIAAGGELATRYGITGWPEGHAAWAAGVMFDCWLAGRGEGGQEDRDAINAVVNYFKNGPPAVNFNFEVCWKQTVRDHECVCILPAEWLNVCGGLKPNQVAEVLYRKELLVVDDRRRQVKVRRQGREPKNVYAVKN